MKTENILGKQVLSSWLQWHFESIALNISSDESYVSGKVDSLYENLDDEFFASEVLIHAENDGAVVE